MIKILKSEVFWVGLIILVGAVLRLYRLDAFPVGLHGDEAWTGIEAVRILKTGFIGFWSHSSYGNPALIFYFTALLFRLFGESVAVLRFSLAILNVLWLPFFYLTIKSLFSRKLAAVSTFLLATGYVSLAFSRKAELLALNCAFFPSLFFALRAAQTGKAKYYLLAGLLLGINLHTNQPFWITPILVITLFLGWFVVAKRFVKNFIFLVSGFLVTASPMLVLGFSPDGPLLARFKSIIITSPESHYQSLYRSQYPTVNSQLVNNFTATVMAFWSRQDLDIRDYFVHGPILDPVSRVLFVVGFFGGVFLLPRNRGKLILVYIFFLVFLSGSIFTVDAPNSRRMQPSVYISYVFVGIGIYGLIEIVNKAPVAMRKIGLGLIVLGIIGLGAYNARVYFKASRSADAKSIMAFQLTEVARFVRSQPHSYVYFYSSRWPYDYETLRFLLQDIPGEDRSSEFSSRSVANDSLLRRPLYIFLPEYTQSLVEVSQGYKEGITLEHLDAQGTLLFTSYQPKI